GQAVGIVRAGVVQEHVAHAEDFAALVHGDFRVVDLAALLRGGEEILLALPGPFDRPTEPHRGPRHQDLLWVVHHDLRPEAATDERRDDPDLRLEEPEQLGQAIPNGDGRLGRVPYRQLLGTRVPARRDGAVLDCGGRPAVIAE